MQKLSPLINHDPIFPPRMDTDSREFPIVWP